MAGAYTFISLFGAFLLAPLTLQASSAASNYYIGAVAEYHPSVGNDSIDQNAKNIIKFIKLASENQADIVVFPETGLMAGAFFLIEERSHYLRYSTYIPDPKDSKVSCDDASSEVIEAVKTISCAAKHYTMYVVININEKAKCDIENCNNTNDFLLYNTNVVFDRKGAVIARYRKWNLFGEPGFNTTKTPQLSTFNTDFGVTFGQFICFDILFRTPALALVHEKNITDIIFSTHWFSELPFLTANEVQSAWSYANDVNFLGSGYNKPVTGSGGSGIYAGKDGAFAKVWSEKRVNAMIIAKIPKFINGQRSKLNEKNDTKLVFFNSSDIPTTDGLEPVPQQTLLHDDILPYNTEPFLPINGTQSVNLCHGEICCKFTINCEHREDLIRENVNYYRYRIAVFDGVRKFGIAGTGGLEVCGLVSCTGNRPNDCTGRFDVKSVIVYPTIFKSITIRTTLRKSSNTSRIPLSLTTKMQPLDVSDFTFQVWEYDADYDNYRYTLDKPRKDLMTFAIYGRNFSGDGLPPTLASAGTRVTSMYIVIMAMIVVILGIKSVCSMSQYKMKNV